MESSSYNAIVFPSDVFNPKKVDEEFAAEAELVQKLGGKIVLIDHNALENEEFIARNVLSRDKASEYDNFIGHPDEYEAMVASIPQTAVYDTGAFYRGWMMSDKTYQFMRWQLGIKLLEMCTDTADYSAAYYFGYWYDIFEKVTPASTYFPADFNWDDAVEMVKEYVGNGPYIVKDHVKSRKHEWDTACFAPNIEKLYDVTREFIRLQGDSLAGGIVVRRFEEFQKDRGEVRVWWVGNKPVMVSPHPDTPELLEDVDVEFIRPYVERLNRPFVTTDLALRKDGAWRVIEVSDGQVSGIPKGFDATALFKALLEYKGW